MSTDRRLSTHDGRRYAILRRRIGRNVKAYRKERGLSQRRLARRAGCVGQYISALESGRATPSFELTFLIAKALHVEFEDLVIGDRATSEMSADEVALLRRFRRLNPGRQEIVTTVVKTLGRETRKKQAKPQLERA